MKLPNWSSLLTAALSILLLLTPLSLWLFAGDNPIVFSTPGLVLKAIGQAAALIGLTLFVIEFVLSARFRLVEWLLSGLNQVYVLHHFLGAFALVFLLAHPLFLGLEYLFISMPLAAAFYVPSLTQTGQWLGIAALNLLILLLIFTFFIKLKYPTWKKTHQFLGVPLFIAFGHTLLVPSVLSQNPVLKVYLISLYLLGIYAYTHRVLLKRWLVKKHHFMVASVRPQKDQVLEISLKPAIEKLAFDPGQFVFITILNHPGIAREAHPFSITSAAGSPLLSVAPKQVGDFTLSLAQLKPGDHVLVEGPYGHFTQKQITNPNQIWVAGGIGITPFLSMLRTFKLDPHPPDRRVHLYYTVKDPQSAPFITELIEIMRALPWFQLTLHSSITQGHLTAARIARSIKNVDNYDVLLCGPLPMMQSVKSQFLDLGLKKHRLHDEAFKLAD